MVKTLEDSSQLFSQAATLMLVGMSFVFGFLGILIVAIKTLISPLASRFPDVAPKTVPKKVSTQVPGEQNAPIVAAISAAVSQYRQSHK